MRIEPDAAFDECSQSDVAFQNDQGSSAVAGQGTQGQQNLSRGFRTTVTAEQTLPAKARESPADFRLEQNDNGDGGIGGKGCEQRSKRLKARPERDFISNDNGQNSDENMRRTRTAH